ncbi:KamA family radical SAM protein [Bdellovibrionota bacterium FG-1]
MWKQELAHSYDSVQALKEAGLISPSEAKKLEALGAQFKVRVTPYYARLMSSSPNCPIRLQAIPALGEQDPELPSWATEWSQRIYGRAHPWHPDAIGDLDKLAVPRLTHRYDNRAILHLSSLCSVYCRFCFRKTHLNDAERTLYDGSLDPAFDYLSQHPEIHELILTGGDPLSLTDSALEKIFERAKNIPHLRVLRIHSRMAVTLPSRFTPELAQIFERSDSLQVFLVNHFNHPQEWTPQSKAALQLIQKSGATLLNQNALLAGINDSAQTLALLYQQLYEHGVIPVYLHHPDWTPGTFQFRVSIEHGSQIARELQGILPGAARPHYVLDIPGGFGKTSLLDSTVRKIHQWAEGPIHGAVYQVRPPKTRTPPNIQKDVQLYLDLFSPSAVSNTP